MKLIR